MKYVYILFIFYLLISIIVTTNSATTSENGNITTFEVSVVTIYTTENLVIPAHEVTTGQNIPKCTYVNSISFLNDVDLYEVMNNVSSVVATTRIMYFYKEFFQIYLRSEVHEMGKQIRTMYRLNFVSIKEFIDLGPIGFFPNEDIEISYDLLNCDNIWEDFITVNETFFFGKLQSGLVEVHGFISQNVNSCSSLPNAVDLYLLVDWIRQMQSNASKLALEFELTMIQTVDGVPVDLSGITMDDIRLQFNNASTIQSPNGDVPLIIRYQENSTKNQPIFHVYYTIDSLNQIPFINFHILETVSQTSSSNTSSSACPYLNNFELYSPNNTTNDTYIIKNSYPNPNPLVTLEIINTKSQSNFMELTMIYEDKRNPKQIIRLTAKATIIQFYEFIDIWMLGYFPGEDPIKTILNVTDGSFGPIISESAYTFSTSFKNNLFKYTGVIFEDIEPCTEPIAFPLDVILSFNWIRTVSKSKFAFEVRYSVVKEINGAVVNFTHPITFQELQGIFSVPYYVTSSETYIALITRFVDNSSATQPEFLAYYTFDTTENMPIDFFLFCDHTLGASSLQHFVYGNNSYLKISVQDKVIGFLNSSYLVFTVVCTVSVILVIIIVWKELKNLYTKRKEEREQIILLN